MERSQSFAQFSKGIKIRLWLTGESPIAKKKQKKMWMWFVQILFQDSPMARSIIIIQSCNLLVTESQDMIKH